MINNSLDLFNLILRCTFEYQQHDQKKENETKWFARVFLFFFWGFPPFYFVRFLFHFSRAFLRDFKHNIWISSKKNNGKQPLFYPLVSVCFVWKITLLQSMRGLDCSVNEGNRQKKKINNIKNIVITQ